MFRIYVLIYLPCHVWKNVKISFWIWLYWQDY